MSIYDFTVDKRKGEVLDLAELKGKVVFPCKQFRGQAPDSDEEILEFCTA